METDCKTSWKGKQLKRMHDGVVPRFCLNYPGSTDTSDEIPSEDSPQIKEEVQSLSDSEAAQEEIVLLNAVKEEVNKEIIPFVESEFVGPKRKRGRPFKRNQVANDTLHVKRKRGRPRKEQQAVIESPHVRRKRSTPFKKRWTTAKAKRKTPDFPDLFKETDDFLCCKSQLTPSEEKPENITGILGRSKRNTPFKKLWITADTSDSDEKEHDQPITTADENFYLKKGKQLKVGKVKWKQVADEGPVTKRKRGRPRKNNVSSAITTLKKTTVLKEAKRSEAYRGGRDGNQSCHQAKLPDVEIKTEQNWLVEIKSEPTLVIDADPEIKSEVNDDLEVITLDEGSTENYNFFGNVNVKNGLQLVCHDNLDASGVATQTLGVTDSVICPSPAANAERPSSTTQSAVSEDESVIVENYNNKLPANSASCSNNRLQRLSSMEERGCDSDNYSAASLPPLLNYARANFENNIINTCGQSLPSPPALQPMFFVNPQESRLDLAAREHHKNVAEATSVPILESVNAIDLTQLCAILRELLPEPWVVSNGQRGLRAMKIGESDRLVAFISICMMITSNGSISITVLGKSLPESHPIFIDNASSFEGPSPLRLTYVLGLFNTLLSAKICSGVVKCQDTVNSSTGVLAVKTYRSKNCALLATVPTCSACCQLTYDKRKQIYADNRTVGHSASFTSVEAYKKKRKISDSAAVEPIPQTISTPAKLADSNISPSAPEKTSSKIESLEIASKKTNLPVVDSGKTSSYSSSFKKPEVDCPLDKDETFRLMGLTRISNVVNSVRKSCRERRSTMKEHCIKNERDFIESNFETLVYLFSTRLFWGPYMYLTRPNLLKAFSEINCILERWHELVEIDPMIFCDQSIPKIKGEDELNALSDDDLRDELICIVTDLVEVKRSFKEHFPKFVKLYRNHRKDAQNKCDSEILVENC